MRDYSLDILRILACMMIVTMHSPLPGGIEDGIFLSSLSYLTAPGVGLFFMISGALLLTVKSDTKSFFPSGFCYSSVGIPILSRHVVCSWSIAGRRTLCWCEQSWIVHAESASFLK